MQWTSPWRFIGKNKKLAAKRRASSRVRRLVTVEPRRRPGTSSGRFDDDMLQGEARAASWTVVVWLRSLGLGKYEAAFRENDIDETVLPNLTAEDLKELGVASLGHRRKLLDAIPALRTYASAQAPSPMVAPVRPIAATTTHAPVAEAVGERRHITVMFCDLVGSTSISAGLDAEEWRDLVGAYLDAASAAVREMGGNVAKKLGDGLMALFGYPVAQENDSERAVRAALSIQRALAELNRNTPGLKNKRTLLREASMREAASWAQLGLGLWKTICSGAGAPGVTGQRTHAVRFDSRALFGVNAHVRVSWMTFSQTKPNLPLPDPVLAGVFHCTSTVLNRRCRRPLPSRPETVGRFRSVREGPCSGPSPRDWYPLFDCRL